MFINHSLTLTATLTGSDAPGSGRMTLTGAIVLVILMVFVVSAFHIEYAYEQLSPNSIDLGNEVFGKFEEGVVPLAIDTSTVIHQTSEKFLSVALSSGLIRAKWKSFDIWNPRLQTLSEGLQPAILRYGGNDADYLIFNRSSHCPYLAGQPFTEAQVELWLDSDRRHKKKTNFTMSATDFDLLNQFAANSQWDLLFDLNVLLRSHGRWDPTNAIEILKCSIEQNYTNNLAFELGNEPNSFKHNFNRTLRGDDLGRDVLTLHTLLKEDPRFKMHFGNSVQVGPDVTRPPRSRRYLAKYLSVVHNSLDAITWHQYYGNGRTATISDFMSPAILDLLPAQIAEVKAVLCDAGIPDAKLWLGESGSMFGGGTKGLSDRYVAGFMWLDKLGVSAKMGISLVIRQTFYGERYSLLDLHLQPLPDYWLSLLFKRLVGSNVLNLKTPPKDDRAVRVYAHCTATSRSNYSPGAITLYALNLRNTSVSLALPVELRSLTKHQYLLTPSGPYGLKSRYVSLNGRRLELIDDRTLPPLAAKQLTPDEAPALPPHSFAFFVIPDANAYACR